MLLLAALYIVSTLLELGGLALVVGGVLEDRRTARQLLSEVEAMQRRREEDPILFTDLRGAQVNSEWAMTMHRRQLALHAGELADAGGRQSIGVGLFAAGAVVSLAANLSAL